jgi:hypothetical protein
MTLQMSSKQYLILVIVQCLYLFALAVSAKGQEVSVLGVEITQSIQGMNAANPSFNNTIPIIKNKPTLVRVYFDTTQSYGAKFMGSLYVRRTSGPGLLQLSSLAPIQAEPRTNERQGLTARLDFLIPNELVGGTGLTVGPLTLFPYPVTITTPMHPNPSAPACVGCGFSITKLFWDVAPLRIRLIGVQYKINGTIYNTLPNPEIASRVFSWLKRAYPVDHNSLSVDYIPFEFDVNTMMTFSPVDYANAQCETTNYFVRDWVRDREVGSLPLNHILRHTHYLGVVYDGTDLSTTPIILAPLFKKGCAEQGFTDEQLPPPSLEHFFMKVGSVPSGPTGPPPGHPWHQKPPWYGDMGIGDGSKGYWDDDGEYGDWYVGHELGHLLGLEHINKNEIDGNRDICSEAEYQGPLGYPFPNGQLSGPDGTYSGFDSEGQHILTTRSLPGQSWHDIMTYCVRQWLSSETYRHIHCRINRESNLPCEGPPGGWDTIITKLYEIEGYTPPPPSPDPPPDFMGFAKAPNRVLDVPTEFKSLRQKLVKKPQKDVLSVASNQSASPHLNILISLNWKKKVGNIQFVTAINDPGTPTGKKDDRVKIRLTDSGGNTADYSVMTPTSTRAILDIPELQWLEAIVPFKPKSTRPCTVKVELVIEGNIIDFLNIDPTTPTPSVGEISLISPEIEGKLHSHLKSAQPLIFVWGTESAGAKPPGAKPPREVGKPKIFYSVLISLDEGKTWQASALLSEPQFELQVERLVDTKSVTLRVTASDGINSTTVTSPVFTIPPIGKLR